VLLTLSTVLGLLHHTDHVLRGDHSGWPFTDHVTPFTYSLVVYLFLLIAFLAARRPGLAAICVAVVLGLTQFSHLVFELPADQYATWANGSNLLGINSAPLGYAAAMLSITLSLALASTLVSLIVDCYRTK
jgi:hypothetical protein